MQAEATPLFAPKAKLLALGSHVPTDISSSYYWPGTVRLGRKKNVEKISDKSRSSFPITRLCSADAAQYILRYKPLYYVYVACLPKG